MTAEQTVRVLTMAAAVVVVLGQSVATERQPTAVMVAMVLEH